jgi:hypothetical protein
MDNRPAINEEVHEHEHTDIPVRTIGKYLLGMVIAGVIVVLVLAGLWNLFRHSIPEEARVPAWQGPRELPPSPRLQIAPTADLAEYQRKEFDRLYSYGWVDRSAGKVHIPIERAIDRIVGSGLPARKAVPATANRPSGNPESGGVSNDTSTR